jgi:hypothetical protein
VRQKASAAFRRRAPRRFSSLPVRMVGLLVIVLLGVAAWDAVGRADSHGKNPMLDAPLVSDILTTASQVSGNIVAAPASSRLVGPTAGVELRRFGKVTSYVTDGTRQSAPAGRDLVAFQTAPLPGDSGQRDAPQLSIDIDGEQQGPLIATPDYIVASVPPGASAVDLVLNDGGIQQSMSLLSGVTSIRNPAVCSRVHRSARIDVRKPISMSVVTSSSEKGITSGTLTLSSVSLSYWADDGRPASAPDRAFLHVVGTLRLAGDKMAYGLDAGLIQMTASGQRPTAAHNAAGDSAQVDDVVDVPADLTSGRIRIGGTITDASGRMTVTTPVVVPFSIPPG